VGERVRCVWAQECVGLDGFVCKCVSDCKCVSHCECVSAGPFYVTKWELVSSGVDMSSDMLGVTAPDTAAGVARARDHLPPGDVTVFAVRVCGPAKVGISGLDEFDDVWKTGIWPDEDEYWTALLNLPGGTHPHVVTVQVQLDSMGSGLKMRVFDDNGESASKLHSRLILPPSDRRMKWFPTVCVSPGQHAQLMM